MEEVRVRVESDDPLALAGLLSMLRGKPGLRIIGRAGAGAAEPVFPDADVVLIDSGWRTVAEVLPLLEEDGPPALLLLREEDPELSPADLPFGPIRGLLSRSAGEEALPAALAAVARGLLVADPALDQRRPHLPRAAAGVLRDGRMPALSPREKEVLRLVAEGLPNKTIAHRLKISEHTVKFHLTSLLAKLGAQSRTEVVVSAIRRGLLPL